MKALIRIFDFIMNDDLTVEPVKFKLMIHTAQLRGSDTYEFSSFVLIIGHSFEAGYVGKYVTTRGTNLILSSCSSGQVPRMTSGTK